VYDGGIFEGFGWVAGKADFDGFTRAVEAALDDGEILVAGQLFESRRIAGFLDLATVCGESLGLTSEITLTERVAQYL
jgi:hypothetical protein